jgi:hypothetical protein
MQLRQFKIILYRRKESPHHEMEFLDIYLTKDSSLLVHAIHSPFYSGFKENHTLLWFKNPYKKIRETRKLESTVFMN